MTCMTDNPIGDLHQALAHAEFEGFSSIEYQARDWLQIRDTGQDSYVTKTRRPTCRDIVVSDMFTQTWGSTALGHGGIGGSSITQAYTIVLHCPSTEQFLVYFGGQFCYKVDASRQNERLSAFLEDCKVQALVDKAGSARYNG